MALIAIVSNALSHFLSFKILKLFRRQTVTELWCVEIVQDEIVKKLIDVFLKRDCHVRY